MTDAKSDALEQAVLELFFWNDATGFLANLGSGTPIAGSSVAGSLHVGLATDAATLAELEQGNVTNEASYGSYARVSISRAAANWPHTGGNDRVVNNADVVFAESSGAPTETIEYFFIAHNAAPGGGVMYAGQLSSTVLVATGTTPRFLAGDLVVIES